LCAQVRCFVSLVSKPEVELGLGGPYQERVQHVLDDVEPEADPVPCAQANVEDCLVGVVRWTTALTRLGQCATFVVEQLRAGQTVYVHCSDGVGRTGVVCAAVVGMLARLPAEEALARAEDAYAKRRFTTRCSPETEEQRTMVRALLDQHSGAGSKTAAAGAAAAAAPPAAAAVAAAAAAARSAATEPEAPATAESAEAAPTQTAQAEAPSKQPQQRQAPTLMMTPRCDFEFVAAPAPAPQPEPQAGGAPDADESGSKPVSPSAEPAEGPLTAQQELRRLQQRFAATAAGVCEEDAEELEKLRLQRLAQLKAEQKAKQEELERRYDAYCAQKTKDDQEGVSKLRGGLIVEDLPSWAQGLAKRKALEGASEGGAEGGGGEGQSVLRPSEQRAADAAAQPNKWGFEH
jgi:hypothetical protein